MQHRDFTELSKNLVEYLNNKDSCELRTGIKILDDIIPFQLGSINLIGARSGAGKTRFALKLIDNYVFRNSRKRRLVYYSCEDTSRNFLMRFIETRSSGRIRHIDLIRKNLNEEQKKFLNSEIQFMVKSPYFNHVDASGMFLDEILKDMKSQVESGVEVFIFDYLQAIKIRSASDTYLKQSLIAETFREFTNKNNILFFGIVQLNRSADDTDRADYMPSMTQITGSGFYEQVANSIILIKRDQAKNKTFFLVRKNRDGGGYCPLLCVDNETYDHPSLPNFNS